VTEETAHPWSVQLVDSYGNVVAGTVDLRRRDGEPCEVHSDEQCTQEVELPASTDDHGSLTVWLYPGRYEWSASYGAITLPWQPFDIGGSGIDAAYVHTEPAPSATWAIAHLLGKYPSVMVVDSGGSWVMPDVSYVDETRLDLIFGSPTSGKAYLN
jgi:hypothetical protein